jgi:plastocyanin
VVWGCKPAAPRFAPDATLRRELGLTDKDEVHRVTLLGGDSEQVRPPTVSLSAGAYVEFVTGDGRIHEVHFELDSLAAAARAFLQESDQASSPPLVNRDSRFVVRFDQAPPGRYPFLVEGNGAPAHGVVVVRPKP